ncbi:MAG: YifB family Mg chelatase-like AAA ATPase [Candidatus Spechtbacterales bacterium]
MPSKLYSATKQGMQTHTVQIETDVSSGLHAFSIVGLPDKAIEESRERISGALKNSKFKSPRHHAKRVVVNLAPADVKKEGGIYDLPIAIGFLLDSNQVKPKVNLEQTIVLGELGLDGKIKPIRGTILYAMHAKDNGFKEIIVPYENANEASLIKGIKVSAPKNIKELVDYIEARRKLSTPEAFLNESPDNLSDADFSMIKGQENAKKAMEIAAAGGHNILMTGPPGSGKTLLARSSISIMPGMSYEESLEVTKVESVCGTLSKKSPLITKRPFRSPHHSSSESAIIGGTGNLQPGEISRAHRGVLFMDEFPEFHRDVLESLRQPMEEGNVTVARAKGTVEYPSQFILIAAANPCPCGYFGDESRECQCTTASIIKYQRKLSGPIADRIDLHVRVPRQNHKKISSDSLEESSQEIRKRVQNARNIQRNRFVKDDIVSNSEMKIRHIKKHAKISPQLNDLLGKAIEKYKLSARAYHSILKVSRTIADLASSEDIKWEHLALALQYAKRESTTL